MKKQSKTAKPACQKCLRQVTHRTAKQRAACRQDEAAIIARDGFTIDGPQDRLGVVFGPAF